MAYVAYHNVELMGVPLDDGPPFGMLSRKPSKHLQGEIVWVVEGTGKRKRYAIRHRYLVDEVKEIDDDYFRYEFFGETGQNFSPGIEIPAEAWRKDFLKSVGNFGIGVAKLQPEFEKQFNTLANVDPSVDIIQDDFEYTESEIRETIASYRSRSSDARAACVAALGFDCVTCGLNFAKVYGDDCAGFIEVHHLKPLARSNSPRRVDPVTDLVPICPNCHRAIHILNCNVDDLRAILVKRRGEPISGSSVDFNFQRTTYQDLTSRSDVGT